MRGFKFVLFFLFSIIGKHSVRSQTLMINEVSNGPSGAKEYVEFVVVSNSVVYNCNSPTPPCIDIRGWMYDDNSGYHGTSGVATGAVRFSFDPLWQCVPLGTIILIYNNVDKNASVPADDFSLTDGNCRIVAPISNTSLFDQNPAIIGAAACSYPTTGWIAGGLWSYTALANASDCSRIVNLAGCEVFSVCYGLADNLNTLIYFSASGNGNVYYFNGINPAIQANWSSGSATTMQTPGLPNNAANTAYINQFNNNCLPITPIVVTATSINAGCTCTGTATANASGSIAGYTYAWYDASYNPIGQTTATAINLCAGVYHVIAISYIGCPDTATVTIGNLTTTTLAVNSPSVCIGSGAILTATPAISGGNYFWTLGGQTSQTIMVTPVATTTYAVSYTVGTCTASGSGMVSVNPLPIVTVNSPTICAGQSAALTANGASTYVWSTGATSNPLTISPATTTNYTVIGTDVNLCKDTTIATVTVNPLPIVVVNSPAICTGQSTTLTASGASTYSWSTGATGNSLTVSPTITTNYTVIGTDINLCKDTTIATVTVNPIPIVSINPSPATMCEGKSITLNASGATTYLWGNSATSASITVSPASNTSYSVIGTSAGCADSATIQVTVKPNPAVDFTPNTSGCPQLIVNFQNIASPSGLAVSTYLWDFGNGAIYSGQTPAQTTTYGIPGTYSVKLTVTYTNGCTRDTLKNNYITVLSVPVAEFTSNASNVDAFEPVVQYSNQSSNAISYFWSFGDSITSSQVNPSHTFAAYGSYATTLITTSADGCIDSVTHIITIQDIFTFYAPNSFSPNNDKLNERFLPLGTGWDASTYQLFIFDRWGNMCFKTRDMDEGWDGKANNGKEIAQIDTYVWKVTLRDIFGKIHSYTGQVNLVR